MSDRDSWCTPKALADALGAFELDPCSNERSHIRAHHKNVWDGVPGSDTDGLSLDFATDYEVFVNPPYSRGQVIRWVEKWRNHDATFLLRWDPSTDWFRCLMENTVWVWHPNFRINFEPPPGVVASSNPFPHALFFTRHEGKREERHYELANMGYFHRT